MGKTTKATYEDACRVFKEKGYELLDTEYINCKTKMTALTNEGYKVMSTYTNIQNTKPLIIEANNPYSIFNINRWLEINSLNIKLLSKEYNKNTTPLEWECDKEHIFEKSWASMQDSKCCPTCARQKTHDSQKTDIDTIKSIFISHGYTPLFEEYKNCRQRLSALTHDNYKIYAQYSTITSGETPLLFGNGNIHTIYNISNYIRLNNLGCKLISTEYIDNSSKLEIECACGEIFYASWAQLSNKGKIKCGKCFKKDQKERDSFSYEYVKEYVEKNGINKLISTKYNKNSEALDVLCGCGKIYPVSFASFKDGKVCCNECVRENTSRECRRKDIENYFNDGRICPCDVCNEKDIKVCSQCKIYEYFKRNHRSLVDNWTIEEYVIVVKMVYDSDIEILNDIAPALNNKTLDDLLKLLDTSLGIGGDKELRVKTNCAYCGKEIIRRKSEYQNGKLYCGMDCRNKMKSEYYVGENNPFFTSLKQECTNCGKEILVAPFKNKRLNQFGENHNFCSHKCFSEFKSKYYRGDKWVGRHEWTEAQRNRSREVIIARMSSGLMPIKNTKPHKKISNLLSDMDIKHTNEYPLKYYCVDIYLKDYNLMIEIMGDYFHSHPFKYEYYDDLNAMQMKNVTKDKRKHTYIKKYNGIEVLYLWESDIINDIEKCKLLINKYIKTNGELYDYNSYNYNITDGVLDFNEIVFDPYFIDRKITIA